MKSAPMILICPGRKPRGSEFSESAAAVSERYVEAIYDAGGAPLVASLLISEAFAAESVRRCDGVLLTGGYDVDPRLYTRSAPRRLLQTVEGIDPHRDLFELLVIREIFRQRKPLLAICRGHQILNVALGGTLWVDIKQQVQGALEHDRSDRKDQLVHEVSVKPGSLLAAIAGRAKFKVNSSHHQAVRRVAPFLQPTAVSSDGMIEALELEAGQGSGLPYLLAVQFHPERLCGAHRLFLDLFASFIDASRLNKKRTV